ncbi:hypothetical protein [Burkholderia contaminans]|uniref:hypothetical protein n=1 Tax=Burkholderia contaminans TaxID=488447 RepID=UPI0020C72FC8|nr:hypothetical protein [Burkholderia contaminans]
MTPLQIIRSLDSLTNAIEVAVARADWSEAVRAAETRSAFLMALSPDQPDEVHTAIGRMREIDIRISITARGNAGGTRRGGPEGVARNPAGAPAAIARRGCHGRPIPFVARIHFTAFRAAHALTRTGF